MKRAAFLLMFALLASAAWTQTQDKTRVSAARCAYTNAAPSCATPLAPRQTASAQFPHAPGPPRPYPRPYHYVDYSNHAAVGALIGFGIGAAAGAARDGNGGTRFVSALFVGGFGALVGGVIGHGIAAFPHHHRYDWPDDEDAVSMPSKPQQAPSSQSDTPALSVQAEPPPAGASTDVNLHSQGTLGTHPASHN